MKNLHSIIILCILAVCIGLYSCSEKRDIFQVQTHPETWQNVTSDQFHGKAVLQTGPKNCQSCHGKDYRGGTANISCFTCHELYPHPQNWKAKGIHGASIVAQLYTLGQCSDCHGNDYSGGSSNISCFQCHDKYPHPNEWLNAQSNNSHGKLIVSDKNNLQTCTGCHGTDYKGGSSTVSCSKCHQSYPHPTDWNKSSEHGLSIVNNTFKLQDCQVCHGNQYTGGGSNISCFTCHQQYPHLSGFLNEEDANFHGKIYESNEQVKSDCKKCHGNDLRGGISNVSCFTCHQSYPHSEGFANVTSLNFHAHYIQENINWDIKICRDCHGDDYKGEGVTKKNCTLCHSQPDGPESCNLCHGSSKNFAPPKDLTGSNSTLDIGVGAHQSHLVENTWSTAYEQNCQLCHLNVKKFDDPGHLNTPPIAEIVFNVIASDSGKYTPVWKHDDAVCSNVYCHGSFIFKREESKNQWGYAFGESEIKGNNPTMNWTQVGTGQDDCGTCHGLPPQGHIKVFECDLCHGNVVDNNNTIINKNLHINGKVDLKPPTNSMELDLILKHLK